MTDHRPPPSALPPAELAGWVQGQLNRGMEWSEIRRARFRRFATLIKLLSLAFSVASTVILGIQDLDFWASLAFSLGAVGVAISAVEPFFNWRARWVLMEESEVRLRRIRDELEYFLARTPPEAIRFEDVDPYFQRSQEVRTDISRRWLDQRHPDQRGM
ncbi:SLATT domain-containing protein [Streptomyces sp. SP18BB07]|nr:SLATT domain-containing protein [Streptomyces sp. SP18BB07]